MIRRPTEEDRDRLADVLVRLSFAVRMASDTATIARFSEKSKIPKELADEARDRASLSRDALAEILSWVAARHPEAYALAQMRLMELTAEEITKEHARRIIDELADMRDVVTDLGELS